jgi:hypothetical protein
VVNAPAEPVGQAQVPILLTPGTTIASRSSAATTAFVTQSSTTTSSTTTSPKTKAGRASQSPPVPPVAVSGGNVAIKVGNSSEQAVVERADNQLIITAGQLKAVVGGLNTDGGQTSLDGGGNVFLQPGDQVRIKLAGFKPGSTMDVWLFSTPVLLGSTNVGNSGTVVGTFTIPRKTKAGAHRVVMTTRTVGGLPVTLAVGINVGNYKNSLRVPTWLIVVPIILAMGFAMFLPPAIRERKKRKKSLV